MWIFPMPNIVDMLLDSLNIWSIDSWLQKFAGLLIIVIALLWIVIIIGVARNITKRTSSLWIQIICILIATLWWPLWLLLYWIIRPARHYLDDVYFTLHLVHCKHCNKINRISDTYCIYCGQNTTIQCKECHSSLATFQEYCWNCGAPTV